jgi:hypothetical protein
VKVAPVGGGPVEDGAVDRSAEGPTPLGSDNLHGTQCRPGACVAHRPGGSSLLARGVLGNRRGGGARVLAAGVVEHADERLGELAAAGDAKLAVDTAEMRLGGRGGDEQRLRDLAIREAFSGEQFGAGLVGDPLCAQMVGEIQLGARLDATAGTAPGEATS